MPDPTQPTLSPTERRIGRLIVPEPSGFRAEERIDWIHDVRLDELLKGHANPNPDGGR